MAQAPIKVTDQREIAKVGTPTPAYLLSLEIESFRCFKDRQSLNLTGPDGSPARWTIILGENGTGKTTLLECIACAFPITTVQRDIDEKTKQPKDTVQLQYLGEDWESYFRSAASNFSVRTTIHTAPLAKRQRTKSFITVERSTYENLKALDLHGLFDDDNKKLKGAAVHIAAGKPATVTTKRFMSDEAMKRSYFSLIAAYGANRVTPPRDAISLSESENAGPMATLFSSDAKLRNAEEWLLQVDYASRASSRSSQKHHLNHIKDALLRMLPEVTDINVASNKNGELPAALFNTRFGQLSLRQLSLGYQTTIAWIVDLASRMRDHYPESADFLKEPAVVLIDEIDLHMHPKWQRKIMNLLSEVFPNAQFIATSHSPLVVQAVENANTIVLSCEDNQAVIRNDQDSVRGWRVDQILTSDLFGLSSARSPKIEQLLERRRLILTKGTLTKRDKRELDEINKEVGSLPTADNAFDQRALDIINSAAKRLEQ